MCTIDHFLLLLLLHVLILVLVLLLLLLLLHVLLLYLQNFKFRTSNFRGGFLIRFGIKWGGFSNQEWGLLYLYIGFSNGTLERRYSRMMLSPPQNMKLYLGHWGSIIRACSLLRVLSYWMIYVYAYVHMHAHNRYMYMYYMHTYWCVYPYIVKEPVGCVVRESFAALRITARATEAAASMSYCVSLLI